ncbi:MAG: sel1 repeat family protein [Verrucomicrobiaceae bacterium]|nr:sel1 repeat family protein [Verrucomicrobiaceae bacterium]
MLLAALKLQLVALASVAGVDSDTLSSPKVKPIIETLEKAVKDAGTDAAKTQTALQSALDEVKKLTEGSTPDKDALYVLGLWARNGLLNASGQQVLDFYEKAAAGADGQVLAKVELAQILLQSFQQDPQRAAQARTLLDEAVGAKNNAARFIKANFMINGQAGYTVDIDEAKKLLDEGSAAGDGACTFGLYQLVGRGVSISDAEGKQTEKIKKDGKAALALLEKSVSQKNQNAMTEYAQRLMSDNDPEIKKDVAKAVSMFKDAAASGNGFANRQLGIMHEQGGVEGVEKDPKKALDSFVAAANANDPAALLWLGNAFQSGYPAGTQEKPTDEKDLLVKRDIGSSLTMYRRAALGGSAEAIFNVGVFYESGTLVDRDAEKAFQLFHRAAVNGLPAAMMKVASAYQNGGGVAQDPVAAEGWYTTAARAGVPAALAIVGQIALSRGDATNAVSYLEMAAAGGLPQAMAALAGIYNQGVGSISKSPTTAWVWTKITEEAIQADKKQAAEVAKRADEIAAKFSAAEKAAAEKALGTQKKRLEDLRNGVKAGEGSSAPAADTKGGATKGKGK